MAKRYAFWDRKSDVYCPGTDPNAKGLTYSTAAGTSRFTAEEWEARHPIPPTAVAVCAAGDYNGAYFGTLAQMMAIAAENGADFSGAVTDQERLDICEATEDAMNDPGDVTESTPEERIAAALELANVLNLPTVNEDDPDAE